MVDEHINERWLPLSPHREAILDCLNKGRAHIEERGHNCSPLFVHEDGGIIELQHVRLIDDRLVGAAKEEAGTTRHVDVCGTIDEIKRLLGEVETSIDQATLEEVLSLLDHATYMIGRMQRRGEAYNRYAAAALALAEQLNALALPSADASDTAAEKLKARLTESPDGIAQDLNQLYQWAEAVRKVAGDSEKVLYAFRDGAIAMDKLNAEIRGGRKWQQK